MAALTKVARAAALLSAIIWLYGCGSPQNGNRLGDADLAVWHASDKRHRSEIAAKIVSSRMFADATHSDIIDALGKPDLITYYGSSVQERYLVGWSGIDNLWLRFEFDDARSKVLDIRVVPD